MENSRYLERSSEWWTAAVAVIVLAFATGCHCQALYIVGLGDDVQWTISSNQYYQDWADERVFHVNDTLHFAYDRSLHNVLVVQTLEEISNCNATNLTVLDTSGITEITLTTNNTSYYIMSSFEDPFGYQADCQYGMSFAFWVGDCESNTPSLAPSRDVGDDGRCSSNSSGQVVMQGNVSGLSVTTIPWGPHPDPYWNSSVVLSSPLRTALAFNYSSRDDYSVYLVEADDYDNCNISNAKQLDFGASAQLSEPGVYHFIDGNQSMCRNSNMRLKVTVFSKYGNSHLQTTWIVYGVVSGSISFGTICFIVYLNRRLKRANGRRKWQNFVDGEPFDSTDEKARASQDKQQLRDGMLREKNGIKTCKLFTLKDLEAATSHFSKGNELGSGAFGTVYKGVLKGGQLVAVKRAMSQRATDVEQFINEVSILSQVNHCNLVKLLGCCLDLKVPLLVYEFIPNGTLQEHLSQSQEGHSTKLDWPRRFNIAIQTAEALKYLHSQAKPPIVHRDVKAANILLDNDFGAKVADFGLSKLIDIGATHVSTAIKGTPGYLDPEYYYNSQLTDKSDVYSYGMVLLELITSKRPVDLTLGPRDQNLAVRLVPVIINKGARDIVDTQLMNGMSEEDFQTVEAVAEVAVACLVKERAPRPFMTEVVEMLQRIRGSKLQADSFFKRNGIPIQNTCKPNNDWMLSALDSLGESTDLESGRQIMQHSRSSVDQTSGPSTSEAILKEGLE